ncbi:MAG: archaellin/type IV pilin N-terminal domain-containing protein [Candidatus Bathyarchaeia archaeon]
MKLLRSKKALSPVVASIILIAVTVAVSIAVAAWMGALAGLFMGGAENLSVGNPWGWDLTPTANDVVYVNVTNNGGSSITLSSVRIGSYVASFIAEYHYYANGTLCATNVNPPVTLKPGEKAGLKITFTGHDFTPSVPYTITIVTAGNREFSTQGAPPGA